MVRTCKEKALNGQEMVYHGQKISGNGPKWSKKCSENVRKLSENGPKPKGHGPRWPGNVQETVKKCQKMVRNGPNFSGNSQ